ncbi:hypothetical protein HK100_001787 [Physocladia obscura]|uniref:A-kinase anchor protein 7-like phosphoesterase domain-containing protein n=1 Tax=Physocladia obscura TaxID=109957 RepID=A0AAD5TBM1_9FUNG|nr:hypothetical protein HK100_001787 [Physocladia obscura]
MCWQRERQRQRPTHFLSLRLDAAQFGEFFGHVRRAHPAQAAHLVQPQSMHITLLMLSVPAAELRAAAACLDAAAAVCRDRFPPPPQAAPSAVSPPPSPRLAVAVKGVGTFGNGRVVWAKVVAPQTDGDSSFPRARPVSIEALTRFANDLQALFASRGYVPSPYHFKPHATLMKIRAPVNPARGKRDSFNPQSPAAQTISSQTVWNYQHWDPWRMTAIINV